MGKIILAGVLVLALAPMTLRGETKAQRLARAARQVESKMEDALTQLQEGAGTNCGGSAYQHDVQRINIRRRNEYRRLGLAQPTFDYPSCGDGESYGYGT